jgi:hypothetical protein
MIIRNNMFNVEKTVYSPREAVQDYDNHGVSEVLQPRRIRSCGRGSSCNSWHYAYLKDAP